MQDVSIEKTNALEKNIKNVKNTFPSNWNIAIGNLTKIILFMGCMYSLLVAVFFQNRSHTKLFAINNAIVSVFQECYRFHFCKQHTSQDNVIKDLISVEEPISWLTFHQVRTVTFLTTFT